MTGKFHTSWGDFHSFKNLAALQFEVFQMLAMNAKCMVGDQLPPRGRIEPYVYELIGKVYAEVEEKEPWCHGARPLCEIAVFTPEEFTVPGASHNLPDAIKGATRMLEEAAQQFDIVDSASDLSPYRVVILPDVIPVDASLAGKLDAYLAQGGSLIATFESGLNPEKSAFGLDVLGVAIASEGPADSAGNLVRGRIYERADYVEYILPRPEVGEGLPPTEHAMYIRGMDVTARPGSEVLADIVPSYFDRTWEHFCSHRHTPSAGQPGNPAIVRTGNAIYFSSPIFTTYQKAAPLWCKRLLLQRTRSAAAGSVDPPQRAVDDPGNDQRTAGSAAADRPPVTLHPGAARRVLRRHRRCHSTPRHLCIGARARHCETGHRRAAGRSAAL